MLSEVINFVFQLKTKNCIGFSKISTFDSCHETYHHKMLFTIGKVVVKQEIGIPIEKDPAPYWANFSLHFFEYKYIHQLISKGSPPANNFHGT